MKYLSIGLRALLTLAFVGAGAGNLAGVGQWFRHVMGIIEVGAAALLWLPHRQVLATALLGATMVGAVIARVEILSTTEGLPAVILGLICVAMIYLHRDQIGKPMGRTA